MDERQAFRSRQLKGEHAPWMSEHPERPIGTRRHDALFQVDLVETQGRDPCLRSLEPGVRLEFFHGWQVALSGRILYEMPERNERVGFATTIVDGEFAVGLVALTGQAQNDVPDQFTQIVGGIGEREELGGILVDWPPALLHHHVVQVGGKYGQRKFAGLQIVTQLHDLMPGFPGSFFCHVVLI